MSENESTPETSTAEPVKRKRGRPPKARPVPDAEAPTLTLNERAPPAPAPDPVAEAPVAPELPPPSPAPEASPSPSPAAASVGGRDSPIPAAPPVPDNRPWWEKKRDKKKQKWLERQQGKNGGGGGPAPAHPPQPPPPGNVPQHFGDLPNPARFTDQTALDALAVQLIGDGSAEPVFLDAVHALTLHELIAQAKKVGASFPDGPPNRRQAMDALMRVVAEKNIPLLDRGWLDLTDAGHGFIVHAHVNYRLYADNSFVPASLVQRHGLKRGHHLEVVLQPTQRGERCPAAVGVRAVMGGKPGATDALLPFEELVPYYPLQRILMEAPIHKDISMRAVDLLTPIGFGQRGLIVAPPRTGKTILLQNIANSIAHNFPEKRLIILLVDERPEEVTDFKRHCKGEVVSSTFDEVPESHVHAAEMVIEKARRLVEGGEHVIILLDSITRLARAYNALTTGGKTMSGGLESNALQKPKRFFGSARNIEGGGSLTILGTALIDTGSRMDEIIFEEFKGTGNCELHLDRGLSDKRIYPAINIDRSGTRKEELIYHPEEMLRVYGLRRAMQGIPPVEAMDMLIQRLKKTKTNAEFLLSLNR
jgi:transcription termination factor Rho